jgi:hypothetical protein
MHVKNKTMLKESIYNFNSFLRELYWKPSLIFKFSTKTFNGIRITRNWQNDRLWNHSRTDFTDLTLLIKSVSFTIKMHYKYNFVTLLWNESCSGQSLLSNWINDQLNYFRKYSQGRLTSSWGSCRPEVAASRYGLSTVSFKHDSNSFTTERFTTFVNKDFLRNYFSIWTKSLLLW